MKWRDFCTSPKRNGFLPVIGHIEQGHGLRAWIKGMDEEHGLKVKIKAHGCEILSDSPMRKTTIVSSRAFPILADL